MADGKNLFHELAHRDPNFAEAHNNLRPVLLQSRESKTAQTEFFDPVRLRPHYAKARYIFAPALHPERKEAESRARFEKAYETASELRNAPRPQE